MDAICVSTTDQNNLKCTVQVLYTINSVDHTTTITSTTSSGNPYIKGQSVVVHYNPSNVNDITLTPVNGKLIGSILIGFSIIVVLGAWFTYYMTMKYKAAAAFEGMAGGLNMARNIF